MLNYIPKKLRSILATKKFKKWVMIFIPMFFIILLIFTATSSFKDKSSQYDASRKADFENMKYLFKVYYESNGYLPEDNNNGNYEGECLNENNNGIFFEIEKYMMAGKKSIPTDPIKTANKHLCPYNLGKFWYKKLMKNQYILCANVEIYNNANIDLSFIKKETTYYQLQEYLIKSKIDKNKFNKLSKDKLGYCLLESFTPIDNIDHYGYINDIKRISDIKNINQAIRSFYKKNKFVPLCNLEIANSECLNNEQGKVSQLLKDFMQFNLFPNDPLELSNNYLCPSSTGRYWYKNLSNNSYILCANVEKKDYINTDLSKIKEFSLSYDELNQVINNYKYQEVAENIDKNKWGYCLSGFLQ